MLELDRIETPENVELQRRIAGIGSRFLAGLIDTLLLVLIWIALAIVLFSTALSSVSVFSTEAFLDSSVWVLAVLFLVFFAVYWGYFAFFELWTNGQSPGKKHMKIRVVTVEGSPVSFANVAIRSLLRVIDALPFGYAVAGLFMFITKRSQRLGDLAAGTVVISEAVPDYSVKGAGRPSGPAVTAVQASDDAIRAAGLTGREYEALRNYMARRHQFPTAVRHRILSKLLVPILGRLNVVLPDTSVARMETFIRDRLLSPQAAPAAQGDPAAERLDDLIRAQQPPAAARNDTREDGP